MTLIRHATPNLTVNRYAKSRRERLVELTEAVGEIARTGMGIEPNCVTSVQQKNPPLELIEKKGLWWAEQDLNLRPSACKANALPTEPSARNPLYIS